MMRNPPIAPEAVSARVVLGTPAQQKAALSSRHTGTAVYSSFAKSYRSMFISLYVRFQCCQMHVNSHRKWASVTNRYGG